MEKGKVAFAILKDLFTESPILAYPDFKRGFILFVDDSKEIRYSIIVY